MKTNSPTSSNQKVGPVRLGTAEKDDELDRVVWLLADSMVVDPQANYQPYLLQRLPKQITLFRDFVKLVFLGPNA